jgi:hypothetical protein
VATVGIVCAALLGGVVLGLTGSLALGGVVTVVVALLLVGLGVVGVRQGEAQPAAMAAHEARQRRLRQVLEPGAGTPPDGVDGAGSGDPSDHGGAPPAQR